MALRFAELFAGAGGGALGLERAGWSCAWHCEIAEFPRRVLARRWPDVPLYGDVTTLDGRHLAPITLLAGGSPCQDLSVAGKRAGLAGSRSGLFHHQMRLWDETRAPYCLWENVCGALSSNKGRDFAAVLSAFVGGAVPVPSDGWRGAGVVSGPAGVAAWRVLDARYFGVPQRRRRVFVLGARAGGVDPAEVLLEPDGVPWHPAPCGEAGEGITPDAGGGVEGEGGVVGFQSSQSGFRAVDTFATLDANYGARRHNGVLAFDWQNSARQGMYVGDRAESLRTNAVPAVCATGEVTHALTYSTPAIGDIREDSVASAITANTGGGGETQNPAFVLDVVIAPTFSAGAHPGGANGMDAVQIADAIMRAEVAGTLTSGLARLAADNAAGGHFPLTNHGIPRRLMPVECERLQGWPDGWTDVPDEKGKPASDAARYRAIGNGIAAPVTEWIGQRLALAIAYYNAPLTEERAA